MEPLDRSSRNCVCRSPVAMARSSCGGVAIPGPSLMSDDSMGGIVSLLCHAFVTFLLRPGMGPGYCGQPVCVCICLCASISVEPLDRSTRIFVQVSCGRGSIRYVLPVL